jgi:tRNA-splicing ligase RtcB
MLTPVHEVEDQALKQLKNIAALPWVFKHVAVMPDVHFGKGATVGSVIAMKDAVSPAAVGVDIGCGMAAMKTSLKASDLPESLRALRSSIERAIPVGFAQHRDPLVFAEGHALWSEFEDLDGRVQHLKAKSMRQAGTLGGGNHFIEVCLDQDQGVWIMLHSGSRNIGNELAKIHIETARNLAHNQDLPDRDLAVFLKGTSQMAAYRRDLFWAQRFAFLNREAMLHQMKAVMAEHFESVAFEAPILCHHNYVSEEVHFGEEVLVTRKGAIRAGRGEWGIIPGSMGARSFIVQGKGNPESFSSASHGAGRKMSRNAARKHFSVQDLAAQTAGVECRKDEGVLDEIPGCYKDIEEVIRNQADLVDVRFELKQVLCVKG